MAKTREALITDAVLEVFHNRKGFDWWWDGGADFIGGRMTIEIARDAIERIRASCVVIEMDGCAVVDWVNAEQAIVQAMREPPLWHVAIKECNDAHRALDHAKVPPRTEVWRRFGDGRQEITMGLEQRIHWLMANRDELLTVVKQLAAQSTLITDARTLVAKVEGP